MATSLDKLQIEITASASSASKTVDELVSKIGKLATSLGSLNSSNIKSASSNLNEVSDTTNQFSTNISKVTKSSNKSAKSFKGLASYIGKFYATYFMAIRGLKKLWSSIESTADYIEAYNYFNVALGKIGSDWSYQYEQYGYENAESYAESFATRLSDSLSKLSGLTMEIGTDGQGILSESGMKNLGLNIQEITQYASQLASVTNSVGQTGEVSLAAASSFTKLAGDISSLFNIDYSTAAKNLQSGLIGQSRALYKYGIDITNATLQTYAYDLGLEKSVTEMTQAEKMQLRMIAILDQSKVSWGDLANTINSPSNMIRQLTNNLKEAGIVLGQLFIPLLQKVLPVINGVTIAIKRLLVNVAGMLGIQIDLDAFGQGYTDLEDDVDDLADSYENAAEAAEEYKNQLLGFDEATKAAEPSDTEDTTAEISTIDLTSEILAATEEYEKMWAQAYDRMENLAENWAGFFEGIFEPIREIFSDIASGDFLELGKDVSGIFTSITKWFSDAISSVPWGELGSNVGNYFSGAVSEVFNNLGNIGTLITNLIGGITSFLKNAISSVDWVKLADNLLDGIIELFNNIDVKSIFSGITSAVNTLSDAVADFIYGIIKNPDKLSSAIGAVAGFIVDFLFESTKSIISTSYHLASAVAEVFINAIYSAITGTDVLAGVQVHTIEYPIDLQIKIDNLNQAISDIQNAISDADITYEASITTDYQAIKDTADAFLELAGQESLTNEEMSKMEGYRLALIESDPAFKKILDDTSLTYGEMKDAVYEYLNSLEKQVKMQAAMNAATKIQEEIYDQEAQAEQYEDLNKQIEEHKKALEDARTIYHEYNNKIRRYNTLKSIGINRTAEEEKEYQKLLSSLKVYEAIRDDAGKTMVSENQALQELQSTYNEYEQNLKDLYFQYDYYIQLAGQASLGTEDLGDAAGETAGEIDGVGSSAEEASGKIDSVGDSAEEASGKIDSVGDSAEEASDKIEEIGTSATQASNESKTATDKIKGNITTLTSGNYGVKIKIESDQSSMDKTKSTISAFVSDVQKALTLPPLEAVFPTVTLPTITVGTNGTLSTSGGKSEPEVFMDFRWAKKAYATGGFPEDGLFFANHNELVGQFSNGKTAVANNEQITEGIKWAAYEGMLMALSQSQNNSNVNVVLQGDADGLFTVIQDKANNYTTQTGRPAFMV